MQLIKRLILSGFLVSTTVMAITSCRPDEDYRKIPDVSDVEVDLVINRFEEDLFSIDTTQIRQGLNGLIRKYPEFSQIYFQRILPLQNPSNPGEKDAEFVRGFLTYQPIRELYQACRNLFGDFSEEANRYQRAFQFLKYYFPDLPTPDVTTYLAEFTLGTFIYEDQSLAVGLDFFLGEDYPYRELDPVNPNFSSYLTRTFNRDHLISKTLMPLVDDLVGPPSGGRMLDFMINNGKELYLLDHLLPTTPDSVKLEFSQPQVEWVRDNELEIWAFFLKEELLYSSDWHKIRKYVDPSPNSPGMPPEAPGRTANWLGWQIIKAFMKENPEMEMRDLIEIKDAQAVLDQSRYKPKRR